MLRQFGKILQDTKPLMLLEDRLPVGSFGVLYGAPKVGKTFIALDWCIKLASQGNSVLYLAGEGISGYGARCRAWMQQNPGRVEDDEVNYLPFYLGERMINFTEHGNAPAYLAEISQELATQEVIQDIHNMGPEGEPLGEPEFVDVPGRIDLIVVDTLSRSLPGVDENDQGEMSKAIDQIDRFRKLTGSTILFIHHTTKADKKRWRGSSVIEGAADVMLLAYAEDGNINVKVEAAREFDTADKEWVYKLTSVGDSAVAVEQEGLLPTKDRILKAVVDGKESIADIASEAKVELAHARVILGRLVEGGAIRRTGHGKYAPA